LHRKAPALVNIKRRTIYLMRRIVAFIWALSHQPVISSYLCFPIQALPNPVILFHVNLARHPYVYVFASLETTRLALDELLIGLDLRQQVLIQVKIGIPTVCHG